MTDYISLASHAIGLPQRKPYKRHGKIYYRPYRNYFSTTEQCDVYDAWETLRLAGYAKSQITESGKHVIFYLTREGLDWLGEKLNMYIYDEEK